MNRKYVYRFDSRCELGGGRRLYEMLEVEQANEIYYDKYRLRLHWSYRFSSIQINCILYMQRHRARI